MLFEGARAELVGAPNRGLAPMFVMMNAARLTVGVEGVGIAERAYQQALAYALERRRAVRPGAPTARRRSSTIRTCAACCADAGQDRGGARHLPAHRASPPTSRAQRPIRRTATTAKLREELLTPIAKAWSHRHGRRGRLDRAAGARRHGLHRGDRRGPVLSRRPHRADLRRHQRHPGHRPDRPQAGAWRAAKGAGRSSTRWPRPPTGSSTIRT